MRSTGSKVQGQDDDTGHVIGEARNRHQSSYFTATGELGNLTETVSLIQYQREDNFTTYIRVKLRL